MIYEFPNLKNKTLSFGYATVTISNGKANINPKNNLQVALAQKLGGRIQITKPPSNMSKKQATHKKGGK